MLGISSWSSKGAVTVTELGTALAVGAAVSVTVTVAVAVAVAVAVEIAEAAEVVEAYPIRHYRNDGTNKYSNTIATL